MNAVRTFPWEQAEPLGDAITDWAWEWIEAHPRARTIGAMFQRDLIVVINEHTGGDVSKVEATALARHICWWANTWNDAAHQGYADADFGSEWRHSLQRFLMLSDAERREWSHQEWDWKREHVHLFREEDGGWLTENEIFTSIHPADIGGKVKAAREILTADRENRDA